MTALTRSPAFRWFDPHYVRDVLSVMNSCGMYNYAGQWS